MKKRALLIIALLVILFLISINAQQPSIPENIPGGNIISNIEIDERTGTPKKLNELQENIELFQTREQNNSFLWKKWAVILGDMPIIGPTLFYTEKFFSFFNIFWKAIFGMEFSWSWAFFASLGIWIVFIIIVFYPSYGIFPNRFIDLLVAVIIASLFGTSGLIAEIVEQIDSIAINFIVFVILVIIISLIVYLYSILMQNLIEKSEDIALEQSKESIKKFGGIVRKSFK